MLKIKGLISDSRGSFTLEVTLITPLILFILISLVFLSMYIYEKIVVLDAAAYSAGQRAETWNNSYKDIETGAIGERLKNDGLYWRLYRDFDKSSLTGEKNKTAYGLAADIMETGIFQNDDELAVNYSNKVLKRIVSVTIDKNVVVPSWLQESLGTNITTTASSQVIEPVEYIRNIEMLEAYSPQVINRIEDYVGRFRGGGAPSNPTSAPPETGTVYATRKSWEGVDKVYHYPGCFHIKHIMKDNLIVFPSPEDAVGYRLCKDCEKRLKTN